MKQRTKTGYAGVLAKKIPSPLATNRSYAEKLFDANSDRQRKAANFIADERIKKLPHLFVHFDVSFPKSKPAWTEWHELLLQVAIAHVPGFQIATTKGRPRKRGLDWDLYARVRLLEIERNITAAAACNVLAKRQAKKSGSPPNGSTFRRRYTAVKAPAARIFAKAAAYERKSEAEILRDFVTSLDVSEN